MIYIEYGFLDSDFTSPGLFPHCLCWKFTEVAHDDCTLLQQDWTVGICSPHQGCYVQTFSAQAFSEGCDKRRCAFQPAPFGQVGVLRGFTREGLPGLPPKLPLKSCSRKTKMKFKLGQQSFRDVSSELFLSLRIVHHGHPFANDLFQDRHAIPKGRMRLQKKRAALFWITALQKKNESEKLAKHQFSKSIFTFRLNFLPNKHWARGKKRAQGPCKDSTRFNRIFIGGWFPLAHVHS